MIPALLKNVISPVHIFRGDQEINVPGMPCVQCPVDLKGEYLALEGDRRIPGRNGPP